MPLPSHVVEEVEALKAQKNFDGAMELVNFHLRNDPLDQDALMQVTDILYCQGEFDGAGRAVDVLDQTKDGGDPMVLYMKWVLAMERNDRASAKKILEKAVKITRGKNYEVLRCLGVSEFRYGNREKWLEIVADARAVNKLHADTIYSLLEMNLLEKKYKMARKLITFYHENHASLQTVEKSLDFYDQRVFLLEKFLAKSAGERLAGNRDGNRQESSENFDGSRRSSSQ